MEQPNLPVFPTGFLPPLLNKGAQSLLFNPVKNSPDVRTLQPAGCHQATIKTPVDHQSKAQGNKRWASVDAREPCIETVRRKTKGNGLTLICLKRMNIFLQQMRYH